MRRVCVPHPRHDRRSRRRQVEVLEVSPEPRAPRAPFNSQHNHNSPSREIHFRLRIDRTIGRAELEFAHRIF